MNNEISLDELQKHCLADDLWVAIDGLVYDLTGFLEKHPGGKNPFLKAAGKDISNYFHHIEKHKSHPGINDYLKTMCKLY